MGILGCSNMYLQFGVVVEIDSSIDGNEMVDTVVESCRRGSPADVAK